MSENTTVVDNKPITEVRKMSYLRRMGLSIADENCICINLWCPGTTSLKMNLYRGGRVIQRVTIPSMKDNGMDDFYSARLYGEDLIRRMDGLSYDFSADGEHFVEATAEVIAGRESFGKKGRIRGRISNPAFDWTGEHRRIIDPADMVIYEAHVRGFTKHKSSGVKNPGTFDGMREKIPYLKKLGVNTLFLQPVYDFDELSVREGLNGEKRINYWGYTKEAYHMAPKSSYSSDPVHPDLEFKTMIKELHKAGMNVVMDMFFSEQGPDYVLECLRHYATYYHIDGFRVIGGIFNPNTVREDPILSHVRFFGYSWEDHPKDAKKPMLFEMNDGFKEIARRFVKSDEGQVDSFYRAFREQRNGVIKVNYITAHDGFTMRDLISYDIKHNEANGEKNRDGTDYNYSWNCGAEGPTRRKGVLKMRTKQEKNILVMLLLGLPVPMILMGDEFGNTQKGNNNAYCLDNATTWLDWGLLEKNKETYDCVRFLLKLRRELPIYHREQAYSGFDHRGFGAPDISNHSKEPWNQSYPFYCRELGILFYGPYLADGDAAGNSGSVKGGRSGAQSKSVTQKSYYFAFNMHWEAHDFYLPDITKGKRWEVLLDTAAAIRKEDGLNEGRTAFRMEPRSVVLLSCPEDEKPKPKRRQKDDRTANRKHQRVSKATPRRG